MLVVLFVSAGVCVCSAARRGGIGLLRDGFLLEAVDGQLVKGQAGKWFFKIQAQVTDGKAQVEAGKPFEMLACANLEAMTSVMKEGGTGSFRLWGRITTYKGRNFIFANYFLPISDTEPVTKPAEQPTPSGFDDDTVIPDDVLDKLKPKHKIAVSRLDRPIEAQTDTVLTGRTGYITRSRDGSWVVFAVDGLGRNLPSRSLRLLPCRALERLQWRQADELGRCRYKAAGVVTTYKDIDYLLLHRAVKLYSHGNFAR